jgi:hypothetical protein
MSAAQSLIRSWFERGVANNEQFMIVVCDTFDWDDYPVYCSEEDFASEYASVNGANMQRIMEVYDLSKDMYTQLGQTRSFNYPASFKPQ